MNSTNNLDLENINNTTTIDDNYCLSPKLDDSIIENTNFPKGIWSLIGSQININNIVDNENNKLDLLDLWNSLPELHYYFRENIEIFTKIMKSDNAISSILGDYLDLQDKINLFNELKLDKNYIMYDAIRSFCENINEFDNIDVLCQYTLLKFPITSSCRIKNINLINTNIFKLIQNIKKIENNIKTNTNIVNKYNNYSTSNINTTEKEYINLLSNFYDLLYEFDPNNKLVKSILNNVSDNNIYEDLLISIELIQKELEDQRRFTNYLWYNQIKTKLETKVIKYLGSDKKLIRLRELINDRLNQMNYYKYIDIIKKYKNELKIYNNKYDLINEFLNN